MKKGNKMNKLSKLTPVSILHYVRLLYRGILFLTVFFVYLTDRLLNHGNVVDFFEERPVILSIVWVVFTIEMILRFIPSRLESPGSQKQFARNYIKTGETQIRTQDNHATMLVALIWIGFNAIFGALQMLGIFDDGIMIVLCCAYSVCDMICILFFCPFQSWFMKNKCCSNCRIYNWDYAMMFTPLFFVKNPYAWSLLAISFALLLRWEITYYLHPERFSEWTNAYLKCSGCTEKLCAHKKQLKTLWGRIAAFTEERTRKLQR